MLTMAPPPPASIAGMAYFMPRNTLRRVAAIAESNSATDTSASGVGGCPPPAALFTPMSRRPNISTVCCIRVATASASVTSVGTTRAVPGPVWLMSAATCSSRAWSRAASTTWAPAAARAHAVAAPMPRLAPVTTATRSRSGRVGSPRARSSSVVVVVGVMPYLLVGR